MEHSIDRSAAPRARHRRGAVSALALAVVMAGCRGGDAPSPAAGPSARRYDVRAEVVALPRPQAKPPQLTLRHEAIPGFVDASGAVVGMSSMVMAFDLAPAASAEGLSPGDKIEVRLAVDWSRPSLQLERVRKLPAETRLRFDAAPADGG